MIGYYDGTVVQVNEPNLAGAAAGGLHKYANPSLIELEKDAWRKAAIEKHVRE